MRLDLSSNKIHSILTNAAVLISCCICFDSIKSQSLYKFQRLGYSQGTYESSLDIINTGNEYFVLTGSIEYIGDNWRYLTYKVNFNFGATLFNLIDGDSVGYNFGYRTSTFYDVKRDKFIVSGFNFQKQDGVIYIQDNGDSNQYEIKTYTKPS